MATRNAATLIGTISILLWGTLALLTKLTDGAIPEFQLMAMTFGIAFLLMAGRWWQRGESGTKYLRQAPLAWLIGVGGLFGYHFCYFKAMTLAPAVEVSLLAYLWPLLIVLLSALLPGESLRRQHIIGALLALAGCWLLIGKNDADFDWNSLPGYLVALACALIWSSYSVLSRLVRSVPTDAVGWFCLVTAVLALGCHWLWEETVLPQGTLQWLGVIGLGLGPVGVAFFTWDYGVKHGNLQLLGTLAYSAPLISVVLLVLAGEAEPSATLFIASLAIVSGSLVAGWQWKRPRITPRGHSKGEAEAIDPATQSSD